MPPPSQLCWPDGPDPARLISTNRSAQHPQSVRRLLWLDVPGAQRQTIHRRCNCRGGYFCNNRGRGGGGYPPLKSGAWYGPGSAGDRGFGERGIPSAMPINGAADR